MSRHSWYKYNPIASKLVIYFSPYGENRDISDVRIKIYNHKNDIEQQYDQSELDQLYEQHDKLIKEYNDKYFYLSFSFIDDKQPHLNNDMCLNRIKTPPKSIHNCVLFTTLSRNEYRDLNNYIPDLQKRIKDMICYIANKMKEL